jgi:D-serine deaminase-like pyridoxal phosphate-dependent protein
VDGFLERFATVARERRDRVSHPDPIVSAGGSAFVDRVLLALGPARLPGWHLVVRSGVYVTHDSGGYDRLSPLSARAERFIGGESLRPALELWARVLSRPEPGLAILGIGHREAPSRLGLPMPLISRSRDGDLTALDPATASITAMNDHHAYLRLPADASLAVGDLVGLGISHPCEAFEKWRTIVAVDEDRRVLGRLATEF